MADPLHRREGDVESVVLRSCAREDPAAAASEEGRPRQRVADHGVVQVPRCDEGDRSGDGRDEAGAVARGGGEAVRRRLVRRIRSRNSAVDGEGEGGLDARTRAMDGDVDTDAVRSRGQSAEEAEAAGCAAGGGGGGCADGQTGRGRRQRCVKRWTGWWTGC